MALLSSADGQGAHARFVLARFPAVKNEKSRRISSDGKPKNISKKILDKNDQKKIRRKIFKNVQKSRTRFRQKKFVKNFRKSSDKIFRRKRLCVIHKREAGVINISPV